MVGQGMVEYSNGTMPGVRPACSPFTLMRFGVQLLLVPRPTLAPHLGYRCLARQPVHACSSAFYPPGLRVTGNMMSSTVEHRTP